MAPLGCHEAVLGGRGHEQWSKFGRRVRVGMRQVLGLDGALVFARRSAAAGPVVGFDSSVFLQVIDEGVPASVASGVVDESRGLADLVLLAGCTAAWI